jgi:RND family efflux transporter MFP subunit
VIKKALVTILTIGVAIAIVINGKKLLENRKSQIEKAPTPETKSISISLVAPKSGLVKQKEKFLAFVAFDKSIKVSTKMAGYIKKIYVKEGDRVKKGELLAKIDEHDINSNISLLKTTLKQQQKDYKLAKQIYQRNLKLYNIGGLPKEQLDTSKVVMDAKRSAIVATELKIEQLEDQKKYLNIKAPFSGNIDSLILHEGDLAVVGKPILSMSSGVKKLVFNYTPSSNIKKAQPVFIEDEKIGEISLIKNIAKNGLAQAEVKLLNPSLSNIPVGVSLDIEVLTKEANGCIVPNNSLLHKRDGVYVMVYKDGKFYPQKVTPALEQDDKTLITPCIKDKIAIGSETTLAKLPIYENITIEDNISK